MSVWKANGRIRAEIMREEELESNEL